MALAGPRADAMKAGLRRYFTGIPCRFGHVAERIVSSKDCVECAAVRRKEKSAENRAYQKERYWSGRTPKTEFPSKAPDYHRRYSAAHYAANRPSYRARDRKRRSQQGASERHHTADDIAQIFLRQRRKCAICRCSIVGGYEADHITPISRGGSNAASNIQLLCTPCNRRKSARDPIAHMQSLGRLL